MEKPKKLPKRTAKNSVNDKIWRAFRRRVNSDERAADLIYKELLKSKLIICDCGCTEFEHEPGARTCICLQCQKENWFTSKAFFKKAKLLRAYMAAIWFYQKNAIITTSEFSRRLRVCISTSWEILKKVKIAMTANLPEDATVEPYQTFVEILLKRSLETEKFQHPSTDLPQTDEIEDKAKATEEAEKASADQEADQISSETTKPPQALTEPETSVYQYLTATPILFDNLLDHCQMTIGELLSTITELEIKGLIIAFPGDRYARVKSAVDKQKQSINEPKHDHQTSCQRAPAFFVELLIALIKGFHHGVSRKYLQLELAGLWSVVSKNFWIENSLLLACLRHPTITRKDILAYSTPVQVKVPALFNQQQQEAPR